MKSLIFRICVLLFLIFCLLPGEVLATAPIIWGYVKVKDTDAPVSGVWVKWVDNLNNIRYEQTDADGKFSFPAWQSYTEIGAVCNKDIDTDLDGTVDTKQASTCVGIGFGCGENPHNYTVIKPYNWLGQFTPASIDLYDMINASYDQQIGMYYWEPEVSCQCDSFTYQGDFVPGGAMTFTGKARAGSPGAKIDSMKYHIYLVNADGTKTEIASSDYITATEEPAGSLMYTTSWSYTFPTEGQGYVNYYAKLEIGCAEKTVQGDIKTAALSKKNTGQYRTLISVLSKYFNFLKTIPPAAYAQVQPTDVVLAPTQPGSLQLGTFQPSRAEPDGCTGLNIWINY